MSEKVIISKDYFKKGMQDWIREFLEYKYLILFSLIVVAIATFLDYFSGVYVSSTATATVPDLILDHIGPIDMRFLFVYGYLAVAFCFFLYPILFHIRKLHIVISQFSVLVIIRSIFIVFTHLQRPADAIVISFPWILKGLSFENDMFFSGHTAIPFLGYLLFKNSKIRYFFLAGSVFLGIAVLAMHEHYSIDVFSAFFITYCSYKVGWLLIRKSTKLIKH
jgi:hypothetical protein